MSIADVVSRVAELESLAQPSATAPSAQSTSSATSFSAVLALAGGQLPGAGMVWALPTSLFQGAQLPGTQTATASGARVLANAETQVGQAEQPPGSNDGPAIAVYRSAVAGAQPGQPWCAYFASWAAAQAGTPLGDNGQGLGAVADITDWASRTGRLLPPSATPTPGDLILFGDDHVGIVESVNPDGSLTTVEGNNANAVSRVQRSPAEATGYVQL